MIPADIDPSLHSGEPAMDSLDDGFSPPPQPAAEADAAGQQPPPERMLGPQSLF